MGSVYRAKVDMVKAPGGSPLTTALFLDKRTGKFFAQVGSERVEADTKDEAVAKVQAALGRVTQVEWRPVIFLVVDKRRERDDEDPFHSGSTNDMSTYSSSLTFRWYRREVAADPLDQKAELEREHTDEFEQRVRDARENVHAWDRAEKEKRADELEKQMRRARSILADVHTKYRYSSDTEELEIPYTPEAWAGIQRIAEAIRQADENLRALSRQASALSLAGAAPPALLPPAILPRKGRQRSAR
jgi:hypothetical protein